MFNDIQIGQGIRVLSGVLAQHFLPLTKAKEVERQRAVFEGEDNITNVLTPAQEEARANGESFVPAIARAEHNATHLIEFGVRLRLEGAYALYKAGDEIECLRYILLALNTICEALGWKKASAYLNEQNGILFKMKDKEREAA